MSVPRPDPALRALAPSPRAPRSPASGSRQPRRPAPDRKGPEPEGTARLRARTSSGCDAWGPGTNSPPGDAPAAGKDHWGASGPFAASVSPVGPRFRPELRGPRGLTDPAGAAPSGIPRPLRPRSPPAARGRSRSAARERWQRRPARGHATRGCEARRPRVLSPWAAGSPRAGLHYGSDRTTSPQRLLLRPHRQGPQGGSKAHRPKAFLWPVFVALVTPSPQFLRAGTVACEKSRALPSGKEISILQTSKTRRTLTPFSTRERGLKIRSA